MSNQKGKGRKRKPKAAVDVAPDDSGGLGWLSPLIELGATVAGGAIGGSAGAAAGAALGKGVSKATGSKPSGAAKAVQTAAGLGSSLAGILGVDSPVAAATMPAPESPAIPAMAAPAVRAGQEMAMQVAAEGMGDSAVARTPMSQMAYDAGAFAPREMQALPQGRMEATGAMGVVPTQGLVYEATPEAAQARREAMLNDLLARRQNLYERGFYTGTDITRTADRLYGDDPVAREGFLAGFRNDDGTISAGRLPGLGDQYAIERMSAEAAQGRALFDRELADEARRLSVPLGGVGLTEEAERRRRALPESPGFPVMR